MTNKNVGFFNCTLFYMSYNAVGYHGTLLNGRTNVDSENALQIGGMLRKLGVVLDCHNAPNESTVHRLMTFETTGSTALSFQLL